MYMREKKLLDSKKRREAKAKPAFKAGTFKDLNARVPGAPLKPSMYITKAGSSLPRQNSTNRTGPALSRPRQYVPVTSSTRLMRAGSRKNEKQVVPTINVDQPGASSSGSSSFAPPSFTFNFRMEAPGSNSLHPATTILTDVLVSRAAQNNLLAGNLRSIMESCFL